MCDSRVQRKIWWCTYSTWVLFWWQNLRQTRKNRSILWALVRVTIRAIFPGHVQARISILPKIYRFWLCLRVQTNRCMTSKYHESYREQTKCLLMLSNSRGTLKSNTDRLSSAALSRTHLICTRICIALTVDPTFSHAMIGPLCIMLACYWSNYFSIITSSKYENTKTKPKRILARTCLGKMGRMVTLL